MDDIRVPDGVRLEAGLGGLECLTIENGQATATIYLHGGHVTAWTPRGGLPVLWLSPLSPFRADKPIRGGVPICFPWFGAHASDASAPAHGVARLAHWTLARADAGPGGTAVELVLPSAAVARPEGQWTARYRVEVGAALGLSIEVSNDGDGPLTFEEALHTYYAVGDAPAVTISGLEDTEYLDKPTGFARVRQGRDPIGFGTEIDRVYLDTTSTCVIHDPVLGRRIRVAKNGSRSTVVWNPGPARGAAMPEVGDGWTGMVCVETCNVGPHAVTLAPGARHRMHARITVES